MKTVLDLLEEYGALSDTKVRRGGRLAPEDEDRWEELDAFFDLLMSQSGLKLQGEQTPIPVTDISDRVSGKSRLRVLTEGRAILQLQGRCFSARVVNLSRGGVFLAAETLLEVGTRPKVYLAGIAEHDTGEVLELEGEVVWRTGQQASKADGPRGMGIRFLTLLEETQEKLDSLVVEKIEARLSGLW